MKDTSAHSHHIFIANAQEQHLNKQQPLMQMLAVRMSNQPLNYFLYFQPIIRTSQDTNTITRPHLTLLNRCIAVVIFTPCQVLSSCLRNEIKLQYPQTTQSKLKRPIKIPLQTNQLKNKLFHQHSGGTWLYYNCNLRPITYQSDVVSVLHCKESNLNLSLALPHFTNLPISHS